MLPKRRRDDPLRVNDGDLAVDAVSGMGVGFDPFEHHANGGVVRGQNVLSGVAIADGEHRGHRLRRRRGDIEPSHRLLPIRTAEQNITTHSGVDAGHDLEELAVNDLAFKPQQFGALAMPDANWFAGVKVVVRQLLDVVGARVSALERRDAGRHASHLPAARHDLLAHLCTRLSQLG